MANKPARIQPDQPDLPAVQHGGGGVLGSVIDRAARLQAPAVAKYVASLRADHPDEMPSQIIERLEKRYLNAVTGSGGAVGAAAAVPHTPLPNGMRMHAALPWNGPSTSAAVGPMSVCRTQNVPSPCQQCCRGNRSSASTYTRMRCLAASWSSRPPCNHPVSQKSSARFCGAAANPVPPACPDA